MLELRTLGTIDLRRDGAERIESVLLHSKRLSLLAYLCASYPTRLHRRDTLVALLWPELDEAHARGALRHDLYELRRALGPGILRGQGAEAVGVDDERIWCDAQAFESALNEDRPDEALSLWHGEFLPGLHVEGGEFERWLDATRTHLAARATEAARRLVAQADGSGDAAGAISWARRLTELAPYDESGWQCLMVVLDRAGDRAGALTAYEAMATKLRLELEIEPSPETQALAQQIRDRAAALSASASRRDGAGGVSAPTDRGTAILIALPPVKNLSGDRRHDRLASRLTDRIAHGLATLDYVRVARGASTANADALVLASIYSAGSMLEVRTSLAEPGESGRILEVPEPALITAQPDDAALDTIVLGVLAAVHAHYDPRIAQGTEPMPFKLPSWQALQESGRGAELFGESRFTEAAEHLRRAYEVDHRDVNSAVFAGIAMMYAGDSAGAESFVTTVMRERAPLPDYERHFGEWLLASLRGRRAEAYRSIMETTRLSNHPALWVTAAREAIFANRPAEAVAMSQSQPLEQGWWGKHTELWEGGGSVRHMLGQHDAELDIVLQARRRFPEWLNILRAEVRARAALGQSDHVLRLVREALTLPHTAGPCGSPVHATPVQVAWVAAQELDAHGYAESAHDARQTALTWLAQQKDVTPADRILEARLLLESGAAPAAQRLLLELAPFEDLEYLAVTGMVAAACGQTAAAEQAAQGLARLANPYLCGRHLLLATGIHAALGRYDEAMDLLRRAITAGLPFGVELHALPFLKPLAGRSDFAELLQPRG